MTLATLTAAIATAVCANLQAGMSRDTAIEAALVRYYRPLAALDRVSPSLGLSVAEQAGRMTVLHCPADWQRAPQRRSAVRRPAPAFNL